MIAIVMRNSLTLLMLDGYRVPRAVQFLLFKLGCPMNCLSLPSGLRVLLAGCGFMLLHTVQLPAALIDFEGVTAPGTQTTDDGTTRTFAGFDVFLPHGHYQGDGFTSPLRPSNGTGWLLHDHFDSTFQQPWVLTQAGGGPFSIQSFDATEWQSDFTRNNVISVSGDLFGGGSIATTFTTDSVFGFETFVFSPAWTNLVAVRFVDLNPNTGFGKIGYDNIVVNSAVNGVPEPASIALLGLGGLGLMRLRRHRKSLTDA